MEIVLSLLAAIALFVAGSHAFAWYEAANADPDLLEQRFHPRRILFALFLLVQETFWLSCSLLAAPFALLPGGTTISPGDERPALLFLHGLFQHRASWWLLRFRLRRAGFVNQTAINLPVWRNVETLTEMIARTVDQLRHQQRIDRVILVGHSMGGMLARNFIQRRGGAGRVAGCILLGTPNRGSRLVPFAISGLARNLLPGSAFLRELNALPFPEEIPLGNIFSRHDNLILPPEHARISFGKEFILKGIGHNGLLYHSGCSRLVIDLLKEIPACSPSTSVPANGSN